MTYEAKRLGWKPPELRNPKVRYKRRMCNKLIACYIVYVYIMPLFYITTGRHKKVIHKKEDF